MYQSFHRYKVYKMKKCPFHKNCYRIAKNAKTYIYARSAYRKTYQGVANCLIFFQVGQRIPRQVIWTYLSLSALTLNMTELTLRHPQDNSVKILWPIQTQQGNQYRQNYVTVTYIWWNKWIDTQLILGVFSRGLKSQQFSRMWTNGLRQFSWTVWE